MRKTQIRACRSGQPERPANNPGQSGSRACAEKSRREFQGFTVAFQEIIANLPVLPLPVQIH